MDITKYYNKVEESIKRKNYDYAIVTLKNQILKFKPNDVKARKMLRAVILEKYKHSGYPSQKDILTKGLVPRIKMVVGKLLKKWDMVIDEAENFLQYDPKNLSALYALGEGCTGAGYIDSAILIFDHLLTFDSNHLKTLKALGRIYKDHKEDWDKAKFYFQRAYKSCPTDIEAEKMTKDLSAQITAQRYGKATSSHELIKDKGKAQELEEDNAILRTDDDYVRAIERTKKKLAKDPNNKKNLKQLGIIYQKLGKFENAIEYYEKILQLFPASSDVKGKISICKIQKVEQYLQKIKEKLRSNPNNETLKQKYAQTLKAKINTEIQEYRLQVKEQPTNYDLRLKLGNALFQASLYDDAIAQFQVLVKDPRKKALAFTYMGKAFTKKKDFSLAEGQFKNALKIQDPNDPQYKEILYYLGLAYETAGKSEKALETYTKIYKEDINFKDVQSKLKKLKK